MGGIVVDEIHGQRNPWFGGLNPEPIRPNVDEALARVREDGYDLGLLLDGDADRSGAVDEQGVFIHQLQVMGLLMYYMLEHRGERAPVVSTVNETAMVQRLGERYGVAVHETPVGFKFVGPRMIETGAMMGGEESGGYGFGMHLPERDGIYADLLLLDLFVRERERGRTTVSSAVAHLHEVAGPSFYLRDDVHADRDSYPAQKARLLVELSSHAPASLGGEPVVRSHAARHRRRLQVLGRRRVVAAGPLQRHRAARAGLRGSQQCDAARCPAGRRPQDGRGRRRAGSMTQVTDSPPAGAGGRPVASSTIPRPCRAPTREACWSSWRACRRRSRKRGASPAR